MMLSVTTPRAGNLVSVGFLLWSPEAAASERRLRHAQRGAGFAEGEGAGFARGVRVGGQQRSCRYSDFKIPLNGMIWPSRAYCLFVYLLFLVA